MARYKPVHQGLKLLPIDFDRQIIPGSFEHALCHLVDKALDLSDFHARYKNDDNGAPAFHPATLLKIVLLAYSRGLISSRKIEDACRENVMFMAVSGDTQPHFTTLAAFVSELGDLVTELFAQVLLLCDRQGLIGRDMFAIDGVKLPSNASKAKSGTREDYQRQLIKMEAIAKKIIDKHQRTDAAPCDNETTQRETKKLARLQKEAEQLRDWLEQNKEDRKGAKGSVRLSNRTDNESAKMATSKGVIQGYTGVAVVDKQSQIIVEAQAHGSGSEQELLLPVVTASEHYRNDTTIIAADSGYHSEANLTALAHQNIDAYIPDHGYRQRDERYAGQGLHKSKPDPLYNKKNAIRKSMTFRVSEFTLADDRSHCTCPAGKHLYRNGSNCTINGFAVMKFTGAQQDCLPCDRRTECLRNPDKTKTRQVAFFLGKRDASSETEKMKIKIDSELGKEMITQRFATVEPVFGNIRSNKQLTRFTLRGRAKVDGQWKLYCMMHNIEKLAHHGYAVH
jgi:transposase